MREYLKYVRQSAEHLLDVVNSVLDLSKIEAGKIELRQESFDLPALLEAILQPFRVQIEQKGLVFRQELDDLPRRVQGDPGRLRQVLYNLLSNAAKFTSAGEVEFAVRLEERSPDSVRLLISVRDTGIGIPAEQAAADLRNLRAAQRSALCQRGRHRPWDWRYPGTWWN